MLELALVAIGAALILLAFVDAVLTVLHPTMSGPVSSLVTRVAWSTLRRIALGTRRAGVLSGAFPTAMLGTFGVWLLLLWFGSALIYLPFLSHLAYDPSVEYGERGLAEALYLSGTALTTVGFGDVVAENTALRMITVVEAAAGFGVMTAALTYLISVYSQISTLRVSARSARSAAQGPEQAARQVIEGGAPALSELYTQLLAIDEDTERFPVLFYVHTREPSKSLATLVRGGALVLCQAKWGIASEVAPYARWYGDQLEQALEETLDHYGRRIAGNRNSEEAPSYRLSDADARRRLERLRRAAGDTGATSTPDAETLRQFARIIGRCEAVLDHLADRHLYSREPLLDG